MPVVSSWGDKSRHNTATSEDDAEYEEDDEVTEKTYSLSKQDNTRKLHRDIVGFHPESDQEDVEMIMNPIKEAEQSPEFKSPQLKRNQQDKSNNEHYGHEGGIISSLRNPRRAQLDERNAETGSDEDIDMNSVASFAEDEDDDLESKKSTDTDVDDRWLSEVEDDDEIMNPNCCIFCHQDEEHDPSEEFELYLSCGVCGDNAHRQCARNANALRPEDEGNTWYCPECVSNDLVRGMATSEDLDQSSRVVVPKKNSADHLLTTKQDNHTNDSRPRRKKESSSCIDTQIEEAKSPRRRAWHQQRGSSHNKNFTPDKKTRSDHIERNPPQLYSQQPLNDQTKNLDTISRAQVLRSLRPKSSSQLQSHATILEKSSSTLKIAIKFDPVSIQNRLSYPPKPNQRKLSSSGTISLPKLSNFVPSSSQHPLYLLHDREAEELKSKPYGGILTEKEADTSLTLPKTEHRRQFDEARQKAEENWKARTTAAAQAAAVSGVKKPRKVSGPASKVEYIEFGDFQIDIWYAAPYPEEYSRNKALFICEFCLKYMESDIVAWRHTTKCPWKNPPGDEIYRDGQVAVFEVDGRKNPLYCQNLCLLAKLFLGSKTLYYDVEPFLFYVMTEYDKYGCHFVGYFSKEKRPSSLNNVSCILVLPIHQRKGYGHLLIDFSYLLTRVEKKTGSPEKPLSDMGLVSYRSYWRLVLCTYLKDFKSGEKIPSIRKISTDMGLSPDDVISALDALGALIRDPITGTYAIKIRPDYYRQVAQNHESKNYVKLNPNALFWTPYVMGRWNVSNFDYTPSIDTLTQRDDDNENHQTDTLLLSPGHKRDFRSFSEPNSASTMASRSIETLHPDQYKIDLCDESKSNSKRAASRPSYYEAAASIPPNRFEVFPPPPSSRGRATARTSARPTPTRQKSSPLTGARSTSRRLDNSSRCTPCSKSHSSSMQRGSSGLGRIAGRWSGETTKGGCNSKEDHMNIGKGKGAGVAPHGSQDSLGKDGKTFILNHFGEAEQQNRDSGQTSGLGKPCLISPELGKDTAPGFGFPPPSSDADVEMSDAPREAGEMYGAGDECRRAL